MKIREIKLFNKLFISEFTVYYEKKGTYCASVLIVFENSFIRYKYLSYFLKLSLNGKDYDKA